MASKGLRLYQTCSAIECGKPASALRCPTCAKLGMTDVFFCSQECFQLMWPVHKLQHDPAYLARLSSEDRSLPSQFAGFSFTGPLRPAAITPQRPLPKELGKASVPNYARSGFPSDEAAADRRGIPVYTARDAEGMRRACRLAREVLDVAGWLVRAGVTTEEIDAAVYEACLARGCYPSPLNYRGFPKSCCTSINEIICHGIPDTRPLKEGDIVNIDVSVFHEGYHGDINEMFFVGRVGEEGKRLVQAAYECMYAAIEQALPGKMYRHLGDHIQKRAARDGLSVVRSYCGHGIGKLFHTQPNVPHYAGNKAVGVIKQGHIFTIEPMINCGSWHDTLWPDKWTSATRDGRLSAQFEHTLLITDKGYEILTARLPGVDYKFPFYVPGSSNDPPPEASSSSETSTTTTTSSSSCSETSSSTSFETSTTSAFESSTPTLKTSTPV
ncbi:MAG: type I methionyl aminopeptidase [archaeon]|nr:type I methionyl aminopeptidase [archaeon]